MARNVDAERMSPKSFIVVGAGLGGLATALRLAHRGHSVTIFEKNGFVGGRCHQIDLGDFHFDGGPTLLMMLDPFRKLFQDVGEHFEDHVSCQLCEPSNRVFFGDGTQIDATTSLDQMVSQIQKISGIKDAKAYPKMLTELADLYEASIPNFVRRNYNSVLDLASPKTAWTAIRHGMLGRLDKVMKKRFQDPRLQNLFCLQTMYLGLCPWEAPSVYGVLTYMEYGQGIWYPKGGLNSIPKAVANLAEKKGVNIILNAEVGQIRGREVELVDGTKHQADAIVCNVDLPFAEAHFLSTGLQLNHAKKKPYRYSCSAAMMYLGYQGDLPAFSHHNIALSRDFNQNLSEIFVKRTLPSDPSFYVAMSSRTEPCMAPDGCQNIFVLIPCPNLDYNWDQESVDTLEGKVYARLESEFGFDRGKVLVKKSRGPADWKEEFSLNQGAAFGLSHDFFQSVCFRPSNRSKSVEGLYFVGASTTPGNGLPMTLISAELVEKRLEEDGLV